MAVRSSPFDTTRTRAWAKVNLTLHVTGRRPDGYHLLDSLIVFAGVGDEIEIAPAPDLTLTVDGPFAKALSGATTPRAGAGAPPANLVMAAAECLRARFGVTAGAALRLHKHLPVAAGIGGGSADAAATLKGLVRLWGLNAADAEVAGLGATLGADVPVCLAGGACFVGGIGECVDPAPPLPPAWLVLVNPGVPLSTAAVFAARRGAYSKGIRWRHPISDPHALAARLAEGGNDLEDAARGLVPQLSEVLAALERAPGCLLARMSGSGATCFGLFAGPGAAKDAAARIDAAHPPWWVRAAPILDRTMESNTSGMARPR